MISQAQLETLKSDFHAVILVPRKLLLDMISEIEESRKSPSPLGPTKICPQCDKEGQKSTIDVGPKLTTLMPPDEYFDESGNYHYDNPNQSSTQYSCSRGHSWVE